ncbi:MAG: M20/M25/M40 family metallo-hydrolase [Candidatus Rokubacteria bacterium]|nr:M20/M25/M40 family metallo-hydrolase [Candidatus Rokubacteria bacterium]
MTGPVDSLKPRVAAAVDRLADELEALSHRIHDHPELCFKEERAHAWLTEFLAKHGAKVERAVGGLPTAFRATIEGAGPGPTIAIMAEYDALPSIGHACGHNVIAAAGTGAGAALAVALGTLPFAGRVQVIGTPAEEGGAGKVRLLEAGVFKAVDAAMMIHGRCGTMVWRPSLGIIKVKAEFHGKATHASSWPWRGVNALNAVIQLFVGLDSSSAPTRASTASSSRAATSRTSSPSTRAPTSTCAHFQETTARSCSGGSRTAPRAPRPPRAAGWR